MCRSPRLKRPENGEITGLHHTILLDWLTLNIEEYQGGELDSAATWVSAGQAQRTIWQNNRHYCLAEDSQRLSWHDFARLRADWKDLSGNFGRSYDRHAGGPARRTVEQLFSHNAACLLAPRDALAEVKIANDIYNNRLQRIAKVEAWSKTPYSGRWRALGRMCGARHTGRMGAGAYQIESACA
jgi:hypothetical protein